MINFELLDIRALIAVADGRSFRRAAEQLNMSQPALSRRIQKLEAEVGTQLIERSTRNVRLTAAGREVVPLMRRMLDEFDGSLIGQMAGGERRVGRITLATIPSAAIRFLPEVLQQFGTFYPNTRVRVLDLSAVECAEAVRTGEAEFGLSLPVSSDSDLVFTPLHEDPYGLVCRSDDALAKGARVSWQDLVGERLITVHRASGNRTTLEAGLAMHGLELSWFYEVTRLTSAAALVEAGLGRSVLPRLACIEPEARNLVWRSLGTPVISRTIGLLKRPSGPISPAGERLISLLTEAWAAASQD